MCKACDHVVRSSKTMCDLYSATAAPEKKKDETQAVDREGPKY